MTSSEILIMYITIITHSAELRQQVKSVLLPEQGRENLVATFSEERNVRFFEGHFLEWLIGMERQDRPPLRAVSVGEEPGQLPEKWPDILMLAQTEMDARAMESLARLTQRIPQMQVVLMSSHCSPPDLLAAMRVGVREVISVPLRGEELAELLGRVTVRQTDHSTGASGGEVYGFTACKGGSGATFIAANLAYVLAVQHEKRVLLLDLDLQYGDASFYFMSGPAAAGSVTSVLSDPVHMDGTLLASSAFRVLPNLHVLSAPEEPKEIAVVTPTLIERLLQVASANYDVVVFDIHRAFDAIALAALDRADRIFPVMQSMVHDMRDARTMLRAFRQLGYPDEKLHFIVNRSDKREDAPLRQIERGLGVDFYRTIPNDYPNASASVSQGVSIVELAPASPVSRAICEMGADLTGAATEQRTWFQKFLRRA